MLKTLITLIFSFVFSLSLAQKEAQTLKARQIVKEYANLLQDYADMPTITKKQNLLNLFEYWVIY